MWLVFSGQVWPLLTISVLCHRHRKSIEGLRLEREERLQSYRRTRSLSPSKHPSSSPQDNGATSKSPSMPSHRKEYLQQLRQEVIDSTRSVSTTIHPKCSCIHQCEQYIYSDTFLLIYIKTEYLTVLEERASARLTLSSCCATTAELERRPGQRSPRRVNG